MDLIAKLEAAEIGSRELDAIIWCLIEGKEYLYMSSILDEPGGRFVKFSYREGQEFSGSREQLYSQFPRYTTSTDAALTLVPERWHVECITTPDEDCHPDSGGRLCHATLTPNLNNDAGWMVGRKREISSATPAIALCIAALKAREGVK